MEFTRKNLLELRKLTIDEISEYYKNKRRWEFENNKPLTNIEFRKKIHKLLYILIQIDRVLTKEKLEVIHDDRIESDNSKIYACTHVGGNDVQRTFEAIKDHAYLFLGDPRGIYKDVAGAMLFGNGVIPVELNDKTDRKIAKARSIELLNRGGNLLIYPEGAWNVMPDLPVMKLYDGAVVMAQETGSDIIPVAIEQFGPQFYASIGKNITPQEISGIPTKEVKTMVRDAMATEKWRIWDHYGVQPREKVANVTVDEYQQEIVDRCGYGFTVQDVFDTMYHDKTIATPEEVFAFQKRLK